jgi:ribosomal protein S21
MRNSNKSYRGNSKRHPKKLSGCIEVTADECQGNADKMVRRFIKRVKNEKILEEARDRKHFQKPSAIRRQKLQETKRLIQKVNKCREELLKPKDRSLFKKRK